MGNNEETRFSLEGIPKFTKPGIKKVIAIMISLMIWNLTQADLSSAATLPNKEAERWKFPEGLT